MNIPSIDSARLRQLLDKVNEFGFNPITGGYQRVGYSDADMAVREWFEAQMQADGLRVHRDAVANVFGRYGPGTGTSVMVGSHLDTVPDGGAFDGALGVCVALECVRAMHDAGVQPAIDIEVVATAEEEGRFGGMLGSQAISGQAGAQWVANARDADGVMLVDALAQQGLDAAAVASAARRAGSVRAFLELHIEQGPVLEAAGYPVGIADCVSGVCVLNVQLQGNANHSGTTPMAFRQDAFQGVADIGHGVPRLIQKQGGEQSRITIGKLALAPNFPHTIAGLAEFSVVLRDTDSAVLAALVEGMHTLVERVSAVHGLQYAVETRSHLPPVALDAALVALARQQAQTLDLAHQVMPSGAGHDAQTMQGFCPSLLVFVASHKGISHAPAEWTDWQDVEAGAQLMLRLLISLSMERM